MGEKGYSLFEKTLTKGAFENKRHDEGCSPKGLKILKYFHPA
jgi:hypothetical protein